MSARKGEALHPGARERAPCGREQNGTIGPNGRTKPTGKAQRFQREAAACAMTSGREDRLDVAIGKMQNKPNRKTATISMHERPET
jgi:hypothetical protein